MKTIKQILIEARDLIATPEQWTMGAYARNANAAPVYIESTEACKFCSSGAIKRVSMDSMPLQNEAFRELLKAIFSRPFADNEDPEIPVVLYNDIHNHEDVIKMFDTAIERQP